MNPGEPLVAGRLLDGRYRIKKVLGVGGMGRVYLGNDTRLASRPVAIKEMIVGEGVKEKKAVEDFAREARVLALLSHPGIPSLIDYFVEHGRHYLVMEYVAGGDLQAMLDKLGQGAKLPEPKVLTWSRQILEVLEFLHAQDPPIVYRDLKPGNIMIDRDGRAMLIDFGIARFLPPGGHGTQIGSVGYAPPEQYMGKMEPRSDLFSLAATMHHLLTGRDPQLEPPFSFPPVRNLNPAVSSKTAEIVTWALDRDVTKRPRDARAMLDALPQGGPVASDLSDGIVDDSGSSRAPISGMKTVVLSNPAATPGSMSAPSSRQARVGGAPVSSTTRTVVLTDPVKSVSSSGLSHGATGARRAQEITEKALSLLSRGLKAGLNAIAPVPYPGGDTAAPPASSSPNAKTRDLSPPSRPMHVARTSAPRTPSAKSTPNIAARSTAKAPPRPAGKTEPEHRARLLARSQDVEFRIIGSHAVIGRSTDPAQNLDVNLVGLGKEADRVSRRHAEVLRRGSDYFIRDLGSLNGTYIVGRGRLGRDQLYKLKDRDQVVLGSAILQFRKG